MRPLEPDPIRADRDCLHAGGCVRLILAEPHEDDVGEGRDVPGFVLRAEGEVDLDLLRCDQSHFLVRSSRRWGRHVADFVERREVLFGDRLQAEPHVVARRRTVAAVVPGGGPEEAGAGAGHFLGDHVRDGVRGLEVGRGHVGDVRETRTVLCFVVGDECEPVVGLGTESGELERLTSSRFARRSVVADGSRGLEVRVVDRKRRVAEVVSLCAAAATIVAGCTPFERNASVGKWARDEVGDVVRGDAIPCVDGGDVGERGDVASRVSASEREGVLSRGEAIEHDLLGDAGGARSRHFRPLRRREERGIRHRTGRIPNFVGRGATVAIVVRRGPCQLDRSFCRGRSGEVGDRGWAVQIRCLRERHLENVRQTRRIVRLVEGHDREVVGRLRDEIVHDRELHLTGDSRRRECDFVCPTEVRRVDRRAGDAKLVPGRLARHGIIARRCPLEDHLCTRCGELREIRDVCRRNRPRIVRRATLRERRLRSACEYRLHRVADARPTLEARRDDECGVE